MQLQMTAPLDIGLEQHDAALSIGQEDVFDLGEAENQMNKRAQIKWLNDDGLEVVDSGESDGQNGSDQEEDVGLSSDEEQNRKVDELEAELDNLYDTYKDRLRERDAKFKVKEERAKNKEREKEWNGIQATDDEDMESDDSGGWNRDEFDGNDTSSSESSDDEDEDKDEGEEDPLAGRKRLRPPKDSALPAAKRQRLVKTLESPSKPSSAATHLWFSQGVFSGLDGVDDLNMNDDEREEESDEDESVEQVCYRTLSIFLSQLSKHQVSDFEVVPASQDDGADTWDANGEDQSAAKSERMQSKCAIQNKLRSFFDVVPRAWS